MRLMVGSTDGILSMLRRSLSYEIQFILFFFFLSCSRSVQISAVLLQKSCGAIRCQTQEEGNPR